MAFRGAERGYGHLLRPCAARRRCELEYVVCEGNQSKLVAHIGKPSQKKATQASHALDLTEYRFHDRLAHSERRRDRRAKLVAHPIGRRRTLG
jgi:hypothetical protein